MQKTLHLENSKCKTYRPKHTSLVAMKSSTSSPLEPLPWPFQRTLRPSKSPNMIHREGSHCSKLWVERKGQRNTFRTHDHLSIQSDRNSCCPQVCCKPIHDFTNTEAPPEGPRQPAWTQLNTFKPLNEMLSSGPRNVSWKQNTDGVHSETNRDT